MLNRSPWPTLCLILTLGGPTGLAAAEWKPVEGKLTTLWTSNVSPETAWAEYPRPQMVRDDWRNLNGLWQYAVTARDAEPPERWDGEILVPFCIESSLSGVGRRVGPGERLWYRRTFAASPPVEDERWLLHFGAVDWDAVVRVNGVLVGRHQGGYDPFTFDITDALKEGDNELLVAVWDPTDAGLQPRGKQVLAPRGIWYTPVTGIWQTVWLEPVPATHVRSLSIVPDVDRSAIHVSVHGSNEAHVRLRARDGHEIVGEAQGRTGRPIPVPIADPKLWSPDSPHLYDLEVELLEDGRTVDRVGSYAGLRQIEVRKDDAGVNRLFLNGQPLFQFGPLDQGWWPDGLYTAPTDAALKHDVEMTRAFGFNMSRKHVKVEPARWYYWCDRLGLLVWQDRPSGNDSGRKDANRLGWVRHGTVEGPELVRPAESAQQYHHELEQLIRDFGNHPSIVVWVPFNERWGQFDTEGIVERVRRLDPHRLVNSASGGNFLGVGDILDVHNYPDPVFPGTDPHQAVVLGEYGGLGLPVEGHTLLDKGNWGYRSFESPEALTAAYLEKIESLRPMIEKGLSAAIYTQISDVEVEVNGLMTYDRKVNKMDTEVIGAANRSLYEESR
jgi:beta-galactosidase/beta-glucuronidase